ncbi:MAG: helix-hairpin-helix domain-containing protein [Candidatus Margulisbacteria bacterium]|nr:helix-hairpin-helix domain-containing protein [Candidatus Margulisiibacteriota bacterium]MBU1021794.1 helix-hairpin-helix domain-containing protein [Candidatus Margulisiibacteriota bacterium]MBU1729540.1 helix-hairpin-helix domain-containing protein [Candidatus Margulisiibacteriota bacterium]MBU1955359.1 helix-hairpin-helix domain-containing protein [Candidatus Margulisiibacteriota bacterium]
MKKWIIIGLAVLLVLVLGYAGFNCFSNHEETVLLKVTEPEIIDGAIQTTTISGEVVKSEPVIPEQVDQIANVMNINTASQAEPQSLNGVGVTIAKRIIEGRPYNKISDILRVKGIGPKKFEGIKETITVD